MPKLLAVIILTAQLMPAATFSFTDVEISFNGSELAAAQTLSTVAACDAFVPTCPSGDLSITGVAVSGPIVVFGDYRSQFLVNGQVAFAVAGEDPLTAMIVEGAIAKSTDETFFLFAEIVTPIWRDRLGTNLLGLHASLPGSLQFSDDALAEFSTTTDLFVNVMVEEPVHAPEPGTLVSAAIAFVIAAAASRRRSTGHRLLQRNTETRSSTAPPVPRG